MFPNCIFQNIYQRRNSGAAFGSIVGSDRQRDLGEARRNSEKCVFLDERRPLSSAETAQGDRHA